MKLCIAFGYPIDYCTVFIRPTQAVHWWEEENADIVGGKDCVAGGTWLASSATGRLAFVTNFREPTSIPEAKSRGNLITRFLKVFLSSLLDIEIMVFN